ncbi:uncharacterized protein LOC124368358 [Homalodisca vitripennis]|uniref:uncharacterized protein LOC124368358 n=1 Tax=Homalodisca vitripennis TaxID=197043 RepID=UPI001EEA0CD0|nr:uncharacterized protein LOC124368358 [Homalodisca vitripennis]
MGDGIPSWLDEKFLAASLQGEQSNQPKVSIVSFKIAPPTTIDGYSSDIYRVHVNYRREGSTQEQSKYLVVKVPDSTGLINILLGPISCEKEHLCYKVLLPKMMSKVKCAFAAESFHSTVDKVIVMEDLGKEYRLADRSKQLDLEHCKLVWATLAKYHASSVAIHAENKEVIDFVATEVFFPEGGVMRQWIELGNRTLGVSLEKQGHKEYADVFLSRIENIWDTLVENVKPQPGRLNVLNHGDLWLNNLFFKYNEAKEPVEVRFIDFQASRYSLPVMDLVYFPVRQCPIRREGISTEGTVQPLPGGPEPHSRGARAIRAVYGTTVEGRFEIIDSLVYRYPHLFRVTHSLQSVNSRPTLQWTGSGRLCIWES